MNKYQKFLAGAVSALGLVLSLSAQATTVDGISWTPTAALTTNTRIDTSGQIFVSSTNNALGAGVSVNGAGPTGANGGIDVINNLVIAAGNPGSTLQDGQFFQAWGAVTLINNVGVASQLTYVMRNWTLAGTNATAIAPANSGNVVITAALVGGTVDFYQSNTGTYAAAVATYNGNQTAANLQSVANAATQSDGPITPWLSLTQFDVGSVTLSYTNVNNSRGLGFSGLFAVAGGAAAFAFDTNALTFGADADGTANGTYNTVLPPTSGVVGANVVLNARTLNIPEPGSLALLGLALVGVGMTARRRKAA